MVVTRAGAACRRERPAQAFRFSACHYYLPNTQAFLGGLATKNATITTIDADAPPKAGASPRRASHEARAKRHATCAPLARGVEDSRESIAKYRLSGTSAILLLRLCHFSTRRDFRRGAMTFSGKAR